MLLFPHTRDRPDKTADHFRLERFEYLEAGDAWALLRVLANLPADLPIPSAPLLAVERAGGTDQLPQFRGSFNQVQCAAGPGSLWRTAFATTLEQARDPQARYTLLLEGMPAVSLPLPELAARSASILDNGPVAPLVFAASPSRAATRRAPQLRAARVAPAVVVSAQLMFGSTLGGFAALAATTTPVKPHSTAIAHPSAPVVHATPPPKPAPTPVKPPVSPVKHLAPPSAAPKLHIQKAGVPAHKSAAKSPAPAPRVAARKAPPSPQPPAGPPPAPTHHARPAHHRCDPQPVVAQQHPRWTNKRHVDLTQQQAPGCQAKSHEPIVVIVGRHDSHGLRQHRHRGAQGLHGARLLRGVAPAPQPHPAAAQPSAAFSPFGAGPTASDMALLLSVSGLYGQHTGPPAWLIPIYKAAGHRYHIPWQVLAAINWIETDYGRDLSTSGAGAVGWMQFMPATWAIYGVDASHTGKPNPYDPRDAIFAAARLLEASGGSNDLRRAIFAYNHAAWYVDAVLWRAHNLGAPSSSRIATNGYALPLDAQYMTQLGRTDDGVDIETAPDGAAVYSITRGIVTAVATDPAGFGPNYPVIQVTSGPLAGRFIYYGHVAVSLVRPGQHVRAGQPIAVMGHTGDAAGLGHGHIEIGFSTPGGDPLSHHGASAWTATGEAMRQVLVALSAAFSIHNS